MSTSAETTRIENQREMDQYLASHDIYGEHEPLKFDLRGYSAYIHEHGLTAKDITPEIRAMFTCE